MDISAKITGIKYTPFLSCQLNSFHIDNLETALSQDVTFILDIDTKRQIAISWWVSAKRTRSYPYARVYNSLRFQGKKVTIIPIVKDEGKEGDRDFLQWDSVSLMSLLGVYTIIAYYSNAEPSQRYKHKITSQRFNIKHIKEEISNLLSYQSDSLHWNLAQIDRAGEIGRKALDSYTTISRKLGIEMHLESSAEKRVKELLKGKENFMRISRELAQKAQSRESVTIQPKEKLSGTKATLTIKNYLGGYYYFTADEVEIDKDAIFLIEGKHTKNSILPSLEDIKDGLIKMILFTNLQEVKIGVKQYSPIPILKLTSDIKFSKELLRQSQLEQLKLLRRESEVNKFRVLINDVNLREIKV